MFDELRRKFGRKKEEEEEIELKPFEEMTGNPTTATMPRREETEAPRVTESGAAPQASITSRSDSVELRVMRPERYQDVGAVADLLLAGCTVVLNVEVLDRASITRMLDFLNGVTYCTDGEIKRAAPNTFIITPHANVDVSDA
jgi:cell division inhibitor SepF